SAPARRAGRRAEAARASSVAGSARPACTVGGLSQTRVAHLVAGSARPACTVGGLSQTRVAHLVAGSATPACTVGGLRQARLSHRTPLASATKRQTLSGSLRPGCVSTPEFTSTAYGRAVATARPTLSGV